MPAMRPTLAACKLQLSMPHLRQDPEQDAASGGPPQTENTAHGSIGMSQQHQGMMMGERGEREALSPQSHKPFTEGSSSHVD